MRWGAFIRERFAPARTVLMVAAFFAGNAVTAAILTGATLSLWPGIPAFIAVLLIFFRLRIFDEIKDCRTDRIAHPDRPLARGLISLREARWVAVAVATAEAALAAVCGPAALLAWGVVLGFSLLMYREFFVGSWLRPKMELYAVTHTLVSGAMGLFVAAALSDRYPWQMSAGVWAFVLVNWAVFNVFEFARKTFGRDEENPRIESYSRRLRPWGAAALCMSQVAFAVAGLSLLLRATGMIWVVVAMAGLPAVGSVAYVCRPRLAVARAYRAIMQLFIVGYYIVLVACVWIQWGSL